MGCGRIVGIVSPRRISRAGGANLGELVQIDGSEHAVRDPARVQLLAFVDDATSRLMELRFVTSEIGFDYFRTTVPILEAHGNGRVLQRQAGIFRVNRKDAPGGDGVTSSAAADGLNSTSSVPTGPQAKTHRRGLAHCRTGSKELRLAGIVDCRRTYGCLGSSPLQHALRPARQCQGPASPLRKPMIWTRSWPGGGAQVTRNLTLHTTG